MKKLWIEKKTQSIIIYLKSLKIPSRLKNKLDILCSYNKKIQLSGKKIFSVELLPPPLGKKANYSIAVRV